MVMPFGLKDSRAKAPAPQRINFDVLWEKALRPVIEGLGYQPVRADQDLGALIIKEMLERLYFSDLVIADVTVPNGNVYYEIGIRHAARDKGCVMIGADWSEPLFDIDQMRQIRYPLAEEVVSDTAAATIRDKLTAAIGPLADGASPMFQTLEGYPGAVSPAHASVVRGYLDDLSRFQADARAVRLAPAAEQPALARALQERYASTRPLIPAVALEVLYVLRDCAGWPTVLTYIQALPPALQGLPVVKEQQSLALSKASSLTSDHLKVIATLEELIQSNGATSEREGLIGGRYKKLYMAANDPIEKRRYLDGAIEHYEKGMRLDLNDYFPSCNLPRLYRQRNARGDDRRALDAAAVAKLACERSMALDPTNEWIRPTLLGIAFDYGDVAAVEELRDKVLLDGPAAWKLATTLSDLELSLSQVKDEERRAALRAVLDSLMAAGSSSAAAATIG
jgi:tetratricopeptide (TPR) repeat protein